MKMLFSKRILAIVLAGCLAAGSIPAVGIEGIGSLVVQAAEGYVIDNGYIKVTVSEKNGGYGIRTVKGDKINKADDNKQLLFEYQDENTSFTSFQVTRNGETKEYIFGGKYDGSSKVSVSKADEALVATWSVDDLTFTQTISLANSGANEHGTAYITYSVDNAGEPAEVKCRMLMDTSLGNRDYAYYNVGDYNRYLERETTLAEDGYSKTFYALDDTGYPSIVAYIMNASIDDEECKPYQTTFAHWNNLAATVFDYTPDDGMTFTNPFNLSYQTADSAFALYFDMGEVAKNASSVIGTYYGVFSNESVVEEATMAINMVAPDVLSFATDANGKEDQSTYENDGVFTIKTYISGVSDYSKIQVLAYTTGGITPMDASGNVTNSTYDNPYYIQISDFKSSETIEYEWSFKAEPKEAGQYAKVHYKIYDVSDAATNNTGTIMKENLLGEGATYILCPGSINKIPAVKFTGTTPDTIYNAGTRMLYLTGDNFGMLADQSSYKVMLSRRDGYAFNNVQSVEIPTSNIELDTTANKMTVMLTDETVGTLPIGMYELKIDYTDAAKEDITAPALRFHVSDSLIYRNDTYGCLAVVKDEENNYHIKHYIKETDYENDLAESGSINKEDVLLEFMGSFIKEKEAEDGTIVYKGVSISKTDNIMTMNDCLDINNGSITITEEDGSVKVDFDADIYTTGAGTSVWSGVAALTELEAGTEYALIGYDENGDRTNSEYTKETIALLWPSVGQGFQELMGLLFEFKYGEFGVITDDEGNELQRVVAFGAALDLSFIIPETVSHTTKTTETDNSWSSVMQYSIDCGPEMIRSVNKQRKYNFDTVTTTAKTTTEMGGNSNFTETASDMGGDAEAGDGDSRAASIQIDDVLFGGEYLGINMSVALGIPGYIEGMPGMEAMLSVRTVGDWAFGVSGVCEFANFCMEVSIQILSKDGIPIPDELIFYIGGFVPGVNVDGWGILWLQGGGGGISNLYDTIFLKSGVPPLKLLIEAQMSLMQVISAKASLGLSLRGIDASITNGKVANAIPVLDSAAVSLQWYPEFFLAGSVNVNIAYDAILGGGYIVVEDDGFFEFFIRAALQIPGSVPIVGGIQIADANLGANAEKLWGQLEALDLTFGVTYFWGEDIDWLSGDKVYPTYPELVGMDGGASLAICPVGFNEVTGQTLYMSVGTNLRQTASTMTAADDANLILLANGEDATPDELYTDPSATKHGMILYENGCKKLLLIEWDAEDEATAKTQADAITIEANGTAYNLIPMDKDKTAEEQPDANANLTYNADNGKATLAISFTNTADFEKAWTIETPVASSLVIYDVAPLPGLAEETTSVAVNGTSASVTLKGDGLSEFTKISFIAANRATGEETLIYYKESATGFADGDAVTFTMPESLGSGDYTLSIVARDENATYYSEATKEFTFTNPNQPAEPIIASVDGAGDYKLAVSMNTGSAADVFDGYAFSAYVLNAESGEYEPVAGVENVLYYKDGSSLVYNENGTIAAPTGDSTSEPFTIGGHYESEYTDEETGEPHTLVAGFSEGEYKLEVKRFKLVDGGKALLYSKAVTQTVNVKKPVETEVTVSAVLQDGTAKEERILTLPNGDNYTQDFYNSNELSLVLSSSSEKVKGSWKLDGGTREGTSGEITELTNQASLYFGNLDEGTHSLSFIGVNEYGDSTAVKYRFTVDTQGPRLLLSEPLNGSLFDYKTGVVTISGITDKDALLTVIDNDTEKTIVENVSMSTDGAAGTISIDADGGFTTNITLDASVLNHNLTIRVADALGNATDKEVLVVSDGLGSIEKLLLYAGNWDETNQKLTAGANYTLKLCAKLEGQDTIVEINNPTLVDWTCLVVEGEAELVENAQSIVLQTSDDAEGMVTARFLINDAGAYTVSAAFGYTGDTIIDLDNQYTEVVLDDEYFYTGGTVEPSVEVWYKDTLLVEGTDYEVTYSNNVDVSTENTVRPQITITGLNSYKGSVTVEFDIVYLELEQEESYYYTPSGELGENGYYTSDVTIVPSEGYEIVTSLRARTAGGLTITEEGNHTVSFWLRRISDGALTDQITLEISIDKSLPTGTITLDERAWDTFLSKITFGLYKVKNYTATVTAEDQISGVEKVEFVVSETAYASVSELEAAGLSWKSYSDTFKPSINENKNQIIYVRMTDKAGNAGYISSEGIIVDTVAPVVSNVYIKADAGLTSSTLEFAFTSNEPGTYYYAVMKASETAPDAASIKAGTVANAVMGTGIINSQSRSIETSIRVGGLQANTLYVAYVVVEDNVINLSDGCAAPNLSSVACSTPVSTKLPTPPMEVPKGETANSPKTMDGMTMFLLVLLLGSVCVSFYGKKNFLKKHRAVK